MTDKDSPVKIDKIEDPEVDLVEPEHEEGAVGGEVQPVGTDSSNKTLQPTTPKPNADRPVSPSDIEALNLDPPDDDDDAGWETADDQSDDDVPAPVQEGNPPDEPKEVMELIQELQLQLQSKPAQDERVESPPGLQVSLYDHQEHALAWMLWREGCSPAGGILADDMGLGKTVTTIALILKSLEDESSQKIEESSKTPGGTLIVCPANLLSQWKREVETKGNIPEVLVHRGGETNEEILTKSKIVITSYDALSRNYQTEDKIFFKIHWKRVVLDEAHVLRNSETCKSKCVAELAAEKRWILTGTLFHNNINNIFPLLRFLKLQPLDDPIVFAKWIATDDAADRLQRVLDCLMLQRTKESLLKSSFSPESSPKIRRLVDVVELSPEEKYVYDRVKTYSKILSIKFVRQMEEDERQKAFGDDYKDVQMTPAQEEFLSRRGTISLHHIVTLITRLRQICCHAALLKDSLEGKDFEGTGVVIPGDDVLMETDRELLEGLVELDGYNEDGGEEKVVDRHVLGMDNPVFDENNISSKIVAILVLVQGIMEKGEKAVVVSHWGNLLSLIGQHLAQIPGASYGFYTELMSSEERAAVIGRFESSEETKILLVSLKAGFRRLDLKTANHLILADVHWNPEGEIQAEDMIHRVGQTKEVFIHKLVCRDTIEEGILEIQKRKMGIVGAIRAGGESESGKLGLADISSLLNM